MSRRVQRVAALAALTAGLTGLGTSAAHAETTICVPNTPWACVYTDQGYWCHKVYGGSNWTEYCVGATGIRQCWKTYPAPVQCQYTP